MFIENSSTWKIWKKNLIKSDMGQVNLTKMIPFEGQMTHAMRKKKSDAMRKTKVVDKSLYTHVEDKSKTSKSWIEVLKSDTKRIEEIRSRTK